MRLAVDDRQAANSTDAQTFFLTGEATRKVLVRRQGGEITLDTNRSGVASATHGTACARSSG